MTPDQEKALRLGRMVIEQLRDVLLLHGIPCTGSNVPSALAAIDAALAETVQALRELAESVAPSDFREACLICGGREPDCCHEIQAARRALSGKREGAATDSQQGFSPPASDSGPGPDHRDGPATNREQSAASAAREADARTLLGPTSEGGSGRVSAAAEVGAEARGAGVLDVVQLAQRTAAMLAPAAPEARDGKGHADE